MTIAQPLINWQTTSTSINPNNIYGQGARFPIDFMRKSVMQPRPCMFSPHGNVSRMSLHNCCKYPQYCRFHQQQMLAKSDHIMQSSSTLRKDPCVNPRVPAQARMHAAAMNPSSDFIVNEFIDTAEGNPFTEYKSFIRQPFLMSSWLLPYSYEFASPLDITVLISNWLSQSMHDDKLELGDNKFTCFHSKSVPQISICGYLQRLTHYAALSPPILLSMAIYLRRLHSTHPALRISSLNVHRLLLACFTVASKCISDCFWTNQIYAQIGGVRARELTHLELELLQCLTWDIVPHTEQLEELYLCLVESHDGYFLVP